MFRRVLTIAVGGTLGVAMVAVVSLRVGAIFGPGTALDAYFVGVAGPSLMLSLIATVIPSYITPRLSVLSDGAAAKRAGEWALLAFSMTSLVAVTLVMARGVVVSILAPGLAHSGAKTASRVLEIYAISLPSTLAASAYSAYGFANGRVWTSGVSSAIYGLVWLGLLFIPRFTSSVAAVSVACVIASQIQLGAAFLCSSARATPRPWPRWRVPTRPAATMLALTGVAVNVAASKANIVLDPILGSLTGKGDVALLVYATRFTILIVALCGQGPALSVLGGRRASSEAGNPMAVTGFGATVLIAVGIAVAVAIGFTPLAVLALAHGEFSVTAATRVGRLVELYAPTMILMTMAWNLEAMLYSMGVTWRLVALNLPGLVVNVALSLILLPIIGVDARPVAVTLAMVIYTCLLVHCVRHLDDGFDPVKAVPKRLAGGLAIFIACGSVATVVGGQALISAPSLWAVASIVIAGVAVLVVTRGWIAKQTGGEKARGHVRVSSGDAEQIVPVAG